MMNMKATLTLVGFCILLVLNVSSATEPSSKDLTALRTLDRAARVTQTNEITQINGHGRQKRSHSFLGRFFNFWRWNYRIYLWRRVFLYRRCYCYWRWSFFLGFFWRIRFYRYRVCTCRNYYTYQPVNSPPPRKGITISCKSCEGTVYQDKPGDDVELCYNPSARQGSTSITSSITVSQYPKSTISEPSRKGSNWYSKTTATGKHTVTYEIRKDSQTKSCSASVTVTRPTCQAPPSIDNAVRKNLNVNANGKVTFECTEGFTISGTSEFTCKHFGKGKTEWQPSQWPTCQPVPCSEELEAPANGTVACTSYVYQGECTYECLDEYTLVGNSKRLCKSDGTWGGISPLCQDEVPPSVVQCAGTTQFADRAIDGTTIPPTEIQYDTPSFEDNSGSVEVYKLSGPSSGDELDIGDYDAVYEAKDQAGNVNNCSLTITIKAIKCPAITDYTNPDINVADCGADDNYGSICSLECGTGEDIIGATTTTCEKVDGLNAGNWTHDRDLPKCHKCGNIRTPRNGLVACEAGPDSKYCAIQCNEGYEFGSFTANYEFNCNQLLGNWNPNSNPDDCVPLSPAEDVSGRVSWRYYSGDCSDSGSQDQIKDNTKTALQQLSPPVCLSGCEIFIICGKTRRKRSLFDLTVEINVKREIDPLDYDNSLISRRNDILEEQNAIYTAVSSDSLPDVSPPAINLQIQSDSVEKQDIKVNCPKGQFYKGNSRRCVGCTYGTHYESASDACIECPIGTYQDVDSQTTCKPCPLGKSTTGTRSKNVTDCKDICLPGYISRNGLAPCRSCPRSYFNPMSRMTQCQPCPEGLTTASEGSSTADHCGEADVLFGLEAKPDESIELVLNRTFKTDTISVVAAVRFRDVDSLVNCHIVQIKEEISEDNMFRLYVNGGDISATVRYHDTYTTTLFKDSLTSDTMANIGFQWDATMGQMHFYQNDVFLGGVEVGNRSAIVTYSENVIVAIGDQCSGVVISGLHIWNSKLLKFPSTICDANIQGDYTSLKEITQSDAASANVRVPALCNDVDNCISNPCQNYGNCTSKYLGYTCKCDLGYTGHNCEINIDDCANSACQNGVRCIDGIGGYTCECGDEFTGEFCQLPIVHGSWGQWSEFGECSKSCGTGERLHTRECTDPPPQNGGTDCIGPVTQTEECGTNICPNCSQIIHPQYGHVNCSEYDDASFECELTCSDGYFLPDDTNSTIYCDQDTGYLWPNQSPGSKQYRPPPCQAYEVPKTIGIKLEVPYKGLDCSSNGKASKALANKANENAKMTECNGQCSQKVQVKNCGATGISKRDSNGPEPSISFSMNQDILSPFPNRTEEELESLTDAELEAEASAVGDSFDDAFNSIDYAGGAITNATENGELDVEIDGVVYAANISAEGFAVEIVCDEFSILVDGVCRSCSAGTFLHSEFGCIPCLNGTYQDLDRQIECKPCPDGFTTDDYGAVLETDCYVVLEEDVIDGFDHPVTDGPAIAIIVGATVGALVGVILIVIGSVLIYRKRQPSGPEPPEPPKKKSERN